VSASDRFHPDFGQSQPQTAAQMGVIALMLAAFFERLRPSLFYSGTGSGEGV
jgi:hypothetical protein